MKTTNQNKTHTSIFSLILLLIATTFFAIPSFSAQRTWTGGTSTDWNTASNWNGSVPTSTDTVTIGAGTYNCILAGNTTVKQFTLSSDSILLGGYVLTVTNNVTIATGFISNGTLSIYGTGVATFSGGTVDVLLNVTAASIKFSGGTYNYPVTAVKKGSTNSTGTGNCTFHSIISLIDSSSNNWTFASTTADTWNDKVTVTHTGTGTIYFAHNSSTANSFAKSVTFTNNSSGEIFCDYYGNSVFHDSIIVNGTSSGIVGFGIGGGITTLDTSIIVIGSSGFSSSGILQLRGIHQDDATKAISLTSTGTTKIQFETGSVWYGTVTATAPYMKLMGSRFLAAANLTYTANNTSASSGGCYFGSTATLTRNATSTGTFSIGVTSADTFTTTTTIQNLNAGTLSIANAKFLGKVTFKNQSSGTSDRFLIAEGGTCTFKDSVTFDNTSSGMKIGDGGSAVFDTSSRINVLSTFTGNFKLYNVTQNGTSPINIPFQSNSDILYFNSGNTFNGPITANTVRVQLNGSTFNNSFYLKRTGGSTDASSGGNVFNGSTTTIIDSNATTHSFSLANSTADDFNGNVIFKQYGTNCKLYPAYVKNSTFAGNITVDGSSAIEFGANGGTLIIDGSANQTLNKTGSFNPAVKKLRMNKDTKKITLNLPLTVSDSLIFTRGVIATDTVNLLLVPDNCIVTGASDTAYVMGPVKKTGNDAFTFPVGSIYYSPLTISAPSNATDAFTAQYFRANHGKGTNADSTIENESTCEYWTLDRNNGSSSVSVKLGWNTLSCNIYGLDSMHVALWDVGTSKWKDKGNGGTTGTLATGTVISSAAVSAFGIFTLADKFCTTLKPQATSTDVTCPGKTDGTTRISPIGATAPYTYSWSPRIGGSVSLWDLSAGTYYITVTDSRNCAITDSVIVNAPDSIQLVITTTDSDCHDSLGTVKIVASGGAGEYFYFWPANGLTSDSIGALPAGVYEVVISDAKGCSFDTVVAISDSDGPDAEIDSLISVDCFGRNSGLLTILCPSCPTGDPIEIYPCGLPNTRLAAGSYPVTVSDTDGCRTTVIAEIIEPEPISLLFSTTKSICGDSTGSATVVASGGTGSYTYSWSSGGEDFEEFYIPSGFDTVIVTDENGCTTLGVALITDTNTFTLSVEKTNVLCYGDSSGVAEISVLGGTTPFQYQWSKNLPDTSSLSNLLAGNYTVLVIDSNGCKQSIDFFISSPEQIKAELFKLEPTNDSAGDGSAWVEVKGGSPDYTYLWSPDSETTSYLNDIGCGSYSVTIVDDNECSKYFDFNFIFHQTDCPNSTGCNAEDYLSCGVAPCNSGNCIPNPCPGCPVINIDDFGADPTDLVSDECAFEAANDYIKNNVCGTMAFTLQFSAGTYIVGRQTPYGESTNFCWLERGHNIFNLNSCGSAAYPIVFKGAVDASGNLLTTIKYEDCLRVGSFVPINDPPVTLDEGDRFLPCCLYEKCKIANLGNLFTLSNSNHVTIMDLELDGNVNNLNLGGATSPNGLEFVHAGIVLYSSSDITIDNVNLHDFAWMGMETHPSGTLENINLVLKDSKFNNNGSCGFAWESGGGVYATNCEFNNNAMEPVRTLDADGLHIESQGHCNPLNCYPHNGHFFNCEFKFNYECGVATTDIRPWGERDFTFTRCLFVGSESGHHRLKDGNPIAMRTPGTKFYCCDFIGPINYAYSADIADVTQGLNNDHMLFYQCTFNEEYDVDGTIYSFTPDCVVPDPSTFVGGDDCNTNSVSIPNHQFLLNVAGVTYSRVSFIGCSFNTNYNDQLFAGLGGSYTGPLSNLYPSLNNMVIQNCSFFNGGLNASGAFLPGVVCPDPMHVTMNGAQDNNVLFVFNSVNFVGLNSFSYVRWGGCSRWSGQPRNFDTPALLDYKWGVAYCYKNNITPCHNVGYTSYIVWTYNDDLGSCGTAFPNTAFDDVNIIPAVGGTNFLPCHPKFTNPDPLNLFGFNYELMPPCSACTTVSEPVGICGTGHRIGTLYSKDEADKIGKLNISPIPTSNVINIENLKAGDEVYLYDVFGNLVLRSASQGERMELNLEKFATGIYILKTRDKVPEKIIKTNVE